MLLMPSAQTPSLLDRFRGCILGQAVGDALGAPFETMPASAIYYGFGFARKIIAAPPVDRLEYTDDTQMMIGVAETLISHGRIRQEELMAAFVANFDPARAYGPGTHQIIDFAAAGGDWRSLSATIFPGGSLGNGAAMRVAPIGLLFHEDLERVAEEAVHSAVLTHSHPIGVDGARLLAIAIAIAIRDPAFDRAAFFAELIHQVATEEFSEAVTQASQLTLNDNVSQLGTSLEAHRSVPTAIACFASYPESYADAVGRAVGLGGDTDTLAARTGALSGAHLGIQGVPAHLLALLENDTMGRDYLDDLARRLLWCLKASPHGSRKTG